MSQMEIDLSRELEWSAVVHVNTQHPHVHVALRGRSDGQPLRLERAYIKSGIRNAAEEVCTTQLGYRTERDAIEAEKREILGQRFTSLDRIINRANQSADMPDSPADERHFPISVSPVRRDASEFARVREHHLRARLIQLETMGLAHVGEGDVWWVLPDRQL